MKVLVATKIEAEILKEAQVSIEIIGFGPVEAAIRAWEILQHHQGPVFLAGIGGAYPHTGLTTGQIVFACQEIFGDLLVCHKGIEANFSLHLPIDRICYLNNPFLEKAISVLEGKFSNLEVGPFVTVCCATRDPQRGERMQQRYGALVENMEGFAVAKVAERFRIPLIEIRAISNLLEDPSRPWEMNKALKNLVEALWCLKKIF